MLFAQNDAKCSLALVVENRGKIDVKLVENMRRGYMRAARFVGN